MIRTHDIYKPLYTDRTHPIVLITGGRGSGKCLKKGTRVIMADLTLRNVEDVRVGEQLMGMDGTPRTVLDTTHGYGDLYKVSQTSGEDYVTNDAHILTLKKSKAAMEDKGDITKRGTYRRPNGRYPNYPEIADIPVMSYAAASKHFRENFRGFKVGQLEYAASGVMIPPYLLGLWLGDGTATYPSVTTPEAEIINYLSAYAEDNGLRFVSGAKKGKAQTYFLRGDGSVGGNAFTNALKHYGLINNKHIPQCYISNSAKNRLELLAGLLDTDGYMSANGYEITQSRYELARQIKFVADTLGFRTSLHHKKAVCEGKAFDAWRVHISGDCWRIPCKVRRRRVFREHCKKNKDWHLSYISVSKEKAQGEWYGFLTDGDHRFLLSDGTVTHNSFSAGSFIERLTFEKKLQMDGASIAHQILYTRYTMVSAAISIIPEFLEKIELDGTARYFSNTKQDVVNRMTGSHIMFRGIKTSSGNQTAKLKSIHGITTFVVDEAEEWTSERDFETIFYSIRQKGIQNRVIIIMNPTDSYHWVYQRFIKDTHRIVDYDGFPVQISTHPQVLHIHTSYLDNLQFLNEEFVKSAQLTREQDPTKYAHLFMGQWADVAEGAVFKHIGEVKAFPEYADKLAIGLDFGFSCFSGDTPVCTLRGEVPIRDVRVGDYVLTRNGYRRVKRHIYNGVKPVIEQELRFANRTICITATPEHLFKANGIWKKYEALTSGDRLFTLFSSMGKHTIAIPQADTTTIISASRQGRMAKSNACIMPSMSFTTGQSPQVTSSTTRTETHSTTHPKTLWHSLRRSIAAFMETCAAGTKVTLWSFVRMLVQGKTGTPAAQRWKCDSHTTCASARTAATSFSLPIRISSIAQSDACTATNTMPRSSMFPLCVNIAERSLWATSISNQSAALILAPISSQAVLEVRRKRAGLCAVYDLEVEGEHEYFAGGVLVHNCDPTAAVLCGVYDDQLYMKELFYERGMKATDIAERLRSYDLPVYSDSADPRLIDDIHLQGINVYPVRKGAGSVLAGIDKMNAMQLLVTSDSRNLLHEFHNYVWDKDKDGNYINRPVDRDNHAIDAVRYYVLYRILGHT